MKKHLKYLAELTSSKSSNDIKSYLEAIPQNEKGKVFEHYLAYLFEGNGYLVKVSGGKGDLGADILLYNPKTSQQVDLIVQTKNWSSPLPFDDVKSELIKFEDRGRKKYNCTFYQLISTNGYVKDAHKLSEFNISLYDWKYVEKLISNYDDSNKSNALIDLRPHNQLSFDKTIEGFEINNRICVIQTTGTGKSYVTARLIQEHIDKKTLLVAPSNLILKQFEENFHYILANTDLVTYAKLANIMKKESKEYDLIILDEFHRCGADIWGTGVETLLDQNANSLVFGTSATPIRTLDQSRDMSDEIFDSYVANQISLPDAIVRSILPEPKYVSALYSIDEDTDNTISLIMASKKQDEEKQKLVDEIKNAKINWEKTSGIPEIFKKHMPIDDKPKKFVVFCQNKDHLADMELDVQKWLLKAFGREWKREAYSIVSDISKSVNEKTIDEFKSANDSKTIYLMFSIDMFNEGLHLPDLDGVILLRPTQSDRIFLQQIGRCLQVGSTSTKPLIFDFVNNFMSLRSFNLVESLDKASKEYNKRRGQLGLAPRIIDVEIIDEAKDIVELFSKINNKVYSWEVQFQYLKGFIQINNRMPDIKENYPDENKLGSWCSEQRKDYHLNILTKDKIGKLDGIYFVWDVIEFNWNNNYQLLLDYINKNRAFPSAKEEYPKGNKLGSWVGMQRYAFKKGQIDKNKIHLLDNIGMIWNTFDDLFDTNVKHLKSFISKFNRWPIKDEEYPKGNKLSNWVKMQRSRYKKNKLSNSQINVLENLNIIWDIKTTQWDEKYKALKDFISKYERMPLSSETLSRWCKTQRQNYSKGKLSNQRIEKLNKLKFIWDEQEYIWNLNYNYLKEFTKRQKMFPKSDEEYPKGNNLGRWILGNKNRYKTGKLSNERIKKLEAIGMIWDALEFQWNKQYNYLTEYIELNDTTPRQKEEFPQGNPLGNWMSIQRRNLKLNKLSKEREQKLNKIKFTWDEKEAEWDSQYNYLKEFVKINNKWPTFREEYPKGNFLGNWYNTQRSSYQKNTLSSIRIEKLEELNIVWGSIFKNKWDEQYKHLENFIDKFNRLPNNNEEYPEGNKIGLWIGKNRSSYNKGTLKKERIDLLEQLGMIWDMLSHQWDEQFNHLKKFILINSKFPEQREEYPKGNKIGNWMSNQREQYKRGKMTTYRLKKLKSINFSFPEIKEKA